VWRGGRQRAVNVDHDDEHHHHGNDDDNHGTADDNHDGGGDYDDHVMGQHDVLYACASA